MADDETNSIIVPVSKPEDGTIDEDRTNNERSTFKDFLDAQAVDCPADYPVPL